MNLGLKGKVALVAAASKGLGYACASVLASEGAYVTISARNKATLEQASQRIERESGNPVLAVIADMAKGEEIEALVAATIQKFGHIDILVNNAGGPPAGHFERLGDEQRLVFSFTSRFSLS